MNTYKVRGLYTISFEMEVEAESREEAEDMGYDLSLETGWNGNSIFSYEDVELCANRGPRDIEVELIEGEEEED